MSNGERQIGRAAAADDGALQTRLGRLLGRPVDELAPIDGAGGYTPALRLRARLADGATAFVKVATNAVTVEMLHTEIARYAAIGPHPFLPVVLAADDGYVPVLVLEDLGHGRWPPPWTVGDVERVLGAMTDVAATRVDRIPAFADVHAELVGLWPQVDAAALAAFGVDPAWLERCRSTFTAAERLEAMEGEALLHVDLRSDNVCLLADRVVLVDWNNACRGAAGFDLVAWAPSLHLEGGPLPHELVPDADPAHVATLTGYFAHRAPLPPIVDAPRVRPSQQAQLRVCLPWLARMLDLPPPW